MSEAPPAPPKLRDMLPGDFFSGGYTESPAARYLDVAVVEVHEPDGLGGVGDRKPWPGAHKHVVKWWTLANGKAVGWNENLSHGWSFPVISLTAAPRVWSKGRRR